MSLIKQHSGNFFLNSAIAFKIKIFGGIAVTSPSCFSKILLLPEIKYKTVYPTFKQLSISFSALSMLNCDMPAVIFIALLLFFHLPKTKVVLNVEEVVVFLPSIRARLRFFSFFSAL